QVRGAGDYMLRYQITSSDGPATRGGISFSVESGGETISASETANGAAVDSEGAKTPAEAAEEAEGMSTWMKWALAGVGVLAVIAVLAVMLAKRRGYDAE